MACFVRTHLHIWGPDKQRYIIDMFLLLHWQDGTDWVDQQKNECEACLERTTYALKPVYLLGIL